MIAPHLADRATLRPRKNDLDLLAHGAKSLHELRAGRVGRLSLRLLEARNEPLFGRARSWTSLQPYSPTRYPDRGKDIAGHLKTDIMTECARRGLPRPEVELLRVDIGPRGGLSAWLRLQFRVAVKGPVLLGRGSHFGEGLFRPCREAATGIPLWGAER